MDPIGCKRYKSNSSPGSQKSESPDISRPRIFLKTKPWRKHFREKEIGCLSLGNAEGYLNQIPVCIITILIYSKVIQQGIV
jgi:hypothetical protein